MLSALQIASAVAMLRSIGELLPFVTEQNELPPQAIRLAAKFGLIRYRTDVFRVNNLYIII